MVTHPDAKTFLTKLDGLWPLARRHELARRPCRYAGCFGPLGYRDNAVLIRECSLEHDGRGIEADRRTPFGEREAAVRFDVLCEGHGVRSCVSCCCLFFLARSFRCHSFISARCARAYCR